MEPQTPSGGDGALAQAQTRVREISARVFDAFISHYNRSPRRVADRLAELGWFGRGGERYNDSTVIGWRNGEFAPSAFVLIAAMLDIDLSFDEIAWGTGLRAEFDRLRQAVADNEERVAQQDRSVVALRELVVGHLGQQLQPDALARLEEIGRPEAAGD